MISILCVARKSNYFNIPDLDLWTEERNAYLFNGNNPIIAHPPCAQWSKMRAFSRPDKVAKNLALFCWEYVNQNGGCLEHPQGSALFKYVGANRSQIVSINQNWFGFPSRKTTYIYFAKCEPERYPLSFDRPLRTTTSLHSKDRSIMPLMMCKWLVHSVSPLLVYHNSHHAPLLK